MLWPLSWLSCIFVVFIGRVCSEQDDIVFKIQYELQLDTSLSLPFVNEGFFEKFRIPISVIQFSVWRYSDKITTLLLMLFNVYTIFYLSERKDTTRDWDIGHFQIMLDRLRFFLNFGFSSRMHFGFFYKMNGWFIANTPRSNYCAKATIN